MRRSTPGIQRTARGRSWRSLWIVTSLIVVLISAGLLWLGTLRGGAPAMSTPVTGRPDAGPSAASPTPTPVPVPGGRYVEGLLGLPATFNPLLASNPAERDVTGVLFEGLTWVDGTGRPQPELAESWTVSDDGLRYTFTLRRGVTWHDGQPFTADDVLFTIRLVQSPEFPGNPPLAKFWRGIRVQVEDPYTVTFSLLEPFAPFPNYASLPILPAHRLRGVIPEDLVDDPFNLEPIGTGPFRLMRFDREGRRVTLARYDGYYGRRPYLDEVEFRFYETTDDLMKAFRDGEVQGAGTVPWEVIARGGDLGEDARVYAPLLSGMTALFFNHQTQFFSDVRVRQAIALAINREALVRDVLLGQAELGMGPIPASLWAYDPTEQPVDVNRARSLLHEAGWGDRDGDGILDSNGVAFRFTLLVNEDDVQRVAVANAIAKQLQQLGIAVTVQPVPSAALQQSLISRQYSAAIFGWFPASGDPDCFELWHSSQAETGLNFSGFRNQTIDTLLLQARQTSNEQDRRSLYAEFQRVFSEQVPAVVLYYPRYFFAVKADIGGVEPLPLIRPSDRLHALPQWFRHA